jgi:alkanesulfonate monooxygenase
MSKIEFYWVAPSTGDGEFLGTWLPERMPTVELLAQVVRAAEASGFDGVLVPTGQRNNHFGPESPYIDSVSAASALAAVTTRIKLLVAIRTGLINPALCARMCATIDLLSGGRFMLNIVSGGTPLAMYGEQLSHEERYRRTDEKIAILKGLWTCDEFNFEGEFYRLSAAVCYPKPLQKPYPPIFFAGQSDVARDIGVREADCMLKLGGPLEESREFAADIRRRAQAAGRDVRVGAHFYVVARRTEAEAFAAAERLLSRVDDRVYAMRHPSAPTPPARAARVADEMVAPNFWGGLQRALGSGWSNALLGSYEQVAAVLRRNVEAGFGVFIITAFPMAEEAERLGENVLPLVPAG